jgi:soluble P-type ATPase
MYLLSNYRRAFAAQRISFDYDETLTKPHGMELAQQWIAKGADVYIISARRNINNMVTRAKKLGIPLSRVYATGSNKAKVEKIKELNISKHYDNNPDVIKELGKIGELYG